MKKEASIKKPEFVPSLFLTLSSDQENSSLRLWYYTSAMAYDPSLVHGIGDEPFFAYVDPFREILT